MRSDSNRLGRFKIDGSIQNDPAGFAWLFDKMVVHEVKPSFFRHEIEYTAWHPSFRALPLGELIPEYEFLVFEGSSIGWVEKL